MSPKLTQKVSLVVIGGASGATDLLIQVHCSRLFQRRYPVGRWHSEEVVGCALEEQDLVTRQHSKFHVRRHRGGIDG